MKIRTGFVSNSSSASFVCRFTSKLPRETLDALIRICSEYLDEQWDVTEKEAMNWKTMRKVKASGKTSWSSPTYKIVKCKPLKDRMLLQIGRSQYILMRDTVMYEDFRNIDIWPFVRALYAQRIPDTQPMKIELEDQPYSIDGMDVSEIYGNATAKYWNGSKPRSGKINAEETEGFLRFQPWELTQRSNDRNGLKGKKAADQEYLQYLEKIEDILSKPRNYLKKF
ncbi:MAG: hypothetical protein LBP68_00210 [Acidobacteriota bacterium]|jgi:hypothetical protein|nr:hypothetical protein [Acidobacteriota bacterium]